jgi:hypothetical protein
MVLAKITHLENRNKKATKSKLALILIAFINLAQFR